MVDPAFSSQPALAETSPQARLDSSPLELDPDLEPRTPELTSLQVLLLASASVILGMILANRWVMIAGMIVTAVIALRVLLPWIQQALAKMAETQAAVRLAAILGLLLVLLGYLDLTGSLDAFLAIYQEPNWDAIGAIGEGIVGAFGQILIALIALWVAWRQYVIERELTTQQNRITQQQTIDSYFQGISDLVLDEEGLLEDWPQERAIAEGRTAALLGSVDNFGKAEILRFLSHSRLLTPLQRDRQLGRAVLNGDGGYAEDRQEGVRVISLNRMLARSNLAQTNLRNIDLSDANLYAANLSGADLTRTNLARAILCQANLREADLENACLFYGSLATTSPRSQTLPPNYQTGAHTGAVVENADFTEAQDLSAEQRYYCCAWGGSKTRATIPGGCEGVPNKLGK
jgi:uncharacterized protein YjbI with pentapeptide repeats